MADFKDRLKLLLNENKMSNAELAKRIGVSRSTIGSNLKGTKPKSENLEKIAKVFNVSTDYLAGLSDVRTPDTTTAGISIATRIPEKGVDALRSLPDYGIEILSEFLSLKRNDKKSFDLFFSEEDAITAQEKKTKLLIIFEKILEDVKEKQNETIRRI